MNRAVPDDEGAVATQVKRIRAVSFGPRALASIECEPDLIDLLGGSGSDHNIGPVLAMPIRHVDAKTTARVGLIASLRALGQRDPQSVFGARERCRLDVGVKGHSRFPVRLGLVEAPLDRLGDVAGQLRAGDDGGVEVVLRDGEGLRLSGARGRIDSRQGRTP